MIGPGSTSEERQRVYWERPHGFRAYDHPVVSFFAQQRIRHMRSWLTLGALQNALDVGCGEGISSYYMKEYMGNIWAVDRSHRMLARHPLRLDGRVAAADVLALPFADASFDLVYGWEVLHHIENPQLAVDEMARVSRRYVLIAEPNRHNPFQLGFALADREHRWVLRYSLAYMQGLLETAGLRVERAERGGWVFPNKTPQCLIRFLRLIPYRSFMGISNWVLGGKAL